MDAYVDAFLQHLNSQQPTIRFTMEIEKDNTIPFLDTSVSRDSNGLLTTTVHRKPTHTDQYLDHDSHILSQSNVVLLSVYTTEPNTSHLNHQLSLKKRNIYHRYLFQTDILLHLYESSQRQQDQQPTKNLRRNLNLLRFYPT